MDWEAAPDYRSARYTMDGGISCEIDHESMGWIPVTLSVADPNTSKLFTIIEAGGNVAPAEPLALETLRTTRLNEINERYNAFVRSLIADYPALEIETFEKQEKEARAWLADSATSTPFLDGMLETRDISKAELVAKVIAKADAIAPMSGRATGHRQTLEAAALEARTAEALDAIVVDYSILCGTREADINGR